MNPDSHSTRNDLLLRMLTPQRLLGIPAAWRYVLAVCAVVAATALRAAMMPLLGTATAYNFALVAVVIVTMLLGMGPGLLTMVLADIGVEVFVLGSLPVTGQTLIRYGIANVIGIFLVSLLHTLRVASIKVGDGNERFRTLVQASSDAVYRMSPDWGEMRRLHGRDFIADTENPDSTWLQQYIHPDDQALVMAAINEAIRNRSAFELEHRVLRVDGSLGWTFTRAVPLLNANNEIIEWLGTASDITQRKRAEETAKAEQAKLAAILENIPDEVWFVDKDTRVTLVNQAVLKDFDENVAVGQRIGKIAAGYEVYCRAGVLRPPEKAPHLRALRGEMVRAEEEIVRVPATGRLHHRLVNASPVMDLQGNLIGSVALVRDITERKRMEDALREAKEEAEKRVGELEALMDAVPALIWISRDAECLSMTGNRAVYEFLGMPAGANVSKTAPQNDRPMHFKALKDGVVVSRDELCMPKAAKGHGVRDYELEYLFDDGTSSASSEA